MRLLLVILLTGCVATESDITQADTSYGNACTVDYATVPTPCIREDGSDGWCEQTVTGNPAGLCVRKCADPVRGGCQRGMSAVFVVGDQCICELPVPQVGSGQQREATRR